MTTVGHFNSHNKTDATTHKPFPSDVTVIGFDPDTFTVGEDVGTVQICAAVLEPSDLSLLDPAFTASVRFFLQDDTAMGKSNQTQIAQSLIKKTLQ